MTAPIPFTQRLDREPRIEEMASALVRAHEEAGLDLRKARLAYSWLHAAMYTDGQISAFGDAALGRARARMQVKAGVDTLMSALSLVLLCAGWLCVWAATSGADAAILSPAGVEAGGDVWLLVIGLIVGLFLGHKIGWLQYGRKIRVVAPDPDDAYTMEQNARRMQR